MKKFLLLFFGIMCLIFSACTTDDYLDGRIDNGVVNLVKAPNVIAYSGDMVLGNTFANKGIATRGTDMNANMWNQTWDCPPRDAEDLTEDELAELKDLLLKSANTVNTVVLPFENYYVQQIYKGEDRYNTHDRCYNTDCDHVNDQTELGSGHMDKLVAIGKDGYEHVNNFNNGTNTNTPGTCGCGVSHFGTTLMTDMPTTGIDPNKQFGFHETWGTSHDYNNYIIVEYKGYYYVGFDYEAHKYDQNTHNHGEGLDIERDWNFTDWIVRITPAYPKGTTPENNPGGILDDPEDPTLDPTTPDQPSTPELKNEVEVNLHADEKHGDYLESHLSIHVRYATDVEIFIPVPKQYYCDKDDMEIVMKHELNHMVHGGPLELKYKLKDSDLEVMLYLSYEDEGIHIWTDGINQDVIDWCAEKCHGDGITFEVWNYFNEALDLDGLKSYLDQATIKFLDEAPDYYVNAFADEDGYKQENDCTVSIVDEQRATFEDEAKEGHWKNGSAYNQIYEKK